MGGENTAKSDSVEPLASSFLEALYGDPLRTETMRTGRHLIIASAICIAVVLFKVRLQSTSLIPVDFGDRVDVLPMLLSLGVLLLLLGFMTRATTDVLRDLETALLVTRYIESERVKAAKAAAEQADDDMAQQHHEDEYGPYEPDPWWEPYYDIKVAADAAVERAEGRIGIRRLPRELRRVRKVLEIGVPIAFAVVALILSKGSLSAFVTALIAEFTP